MIIWSNSDYRVSRLRISNGGKRSLNIMVIKHAKEEMTIEDFKKKYPHMIKEDVAQGSDADMQKGSTLARDYFWAQKVSAEDM